MKEKPGVRIVPQGNSWTVDYDNPNHTSGVFDSQDDAVNYGRSIAEREQTELWIYESEVSSPRRIDIWAVGYTSPAGGTNVPTLDDDDGEEMAEEAYAQTGGDPNVEPLDDDDDDEVALVEAD